MQKNKINGILKLLSIREGFAIYFFAICSIILIVIVRLNYINLNFKIVLESLLNFVDHILSNCCYQVIPHLYPETRPKLKSAKRGGVNDSHIK